MDEKPTTLPGGLLFHALPSVNHDRGPAISLKCLTLLFGFAVICVLIAALEYRFRRHGNSTSPLPRGSKSDSTSQFRFAKLPILPTTTPPLNGWVDYDRRKDRLKNLSHNERIDYYNHRVAKVVLWPLERILADLVHDDSGGSALLVFGVAVCSAIEASGRFLSGHTGHAKLGENHQRFRNFVERYMDSGLRSVLNEETYADIIWKHFRNGLSHGFTVSRGGFEGNRGEPYTQIRSGALIVNPYLFYDDFYQGFNHYLADLRLAQPTGQLYTDFDQVFTAVFIQGN